MKLIFAVLYASLSDGPYTLLYKRQFFRFYFHVMTAGYSCTTITEQYNLVVTKG